MVQRQLQRLQAGAAQRHPSWVRMAPSPYSARRRIPDTGPMPDDNSLMPDHAVADGSRTATVPAGSSSMVHAYMAARAAARGHLLMYRVGEFYEVLFEDAAVVSRLLGIAMTRRPQKNADDIPMCGIPAGSADAAVARLLAAGCKVALSEQPGEPSGDHPPLRWLSRTSRGANSPDLNDR